MHPDRAARHDPQRHHRLPAQHRRGRRDCAAVAQGALLLLRTTLCRPAGCQQRHGQRFRIAPHRRGRCPDLRHAGHRRAQRFLPLHLADGRADRGRTGDHLDQIQGQQNPQQHHSRKPGRYLLPQRRGQHGRRELHLRRRLLHQRDEHLARHGQRQPGRDPCDRAGPDRPQQLHRKRRRERYPRLALRHVGRVGLQRRRSGQEHRQYRFLPAGPQREDLQQHVHQLQRDELGSAFQRQPHQQQRCLRGEIADQRADVQQRLAGRQQRDHQRDQSGDEQCDRLYAHRPRGLGSQLHLRT